MCGCHAVISHIRWVYGGNHSYVYTTVTHKWSKQLHGVSSTNHYVRNVSGKLWLTVSVKDSFSSRLFPVDLSIVQNNWNMISLCKMHPYSTAEIAVAQVKLLSILLYLHSHYLYVTKRSIEAETRSLLDKRDSNLLKWHGLTHANISYQLRQYRCQRNVKQSPLISEFTWSWWSRVLWVRDAYAVIVCCFHIYQAGFELLSLSHVVFIILSRHSSGCRAILRIKPPNNNGCEV